MSNHKSDLLGKMRSRLYKYNKEKLKINDNIYRERQRDRERERERDLTVYSKISKPQPEISAMAKYHCCDTHYNVL